MSDEPGPGAVELAELFHEIYERRAPEFGYTTRTDTRRFDRGSHNGKLMIAVCDDVLTWMDMRHDKVQGLKEALTRYAQHDSACASNVPLSPPRGFHRRPCSCGLEEARKVAWA